MTRVTAAEIFYSFNLAQIQSRSQIKADIIYFNLLTKCFSTHVRQADCKFAATY
jgi:hypothetical protein